MPIASVLSVWVALLGPVAVAAAPAAAEPTPPARVVAARDAVDWEAASAQAAEHLSAFLQVDTTNPPGGERAGAEWMAARLAAEGITAEIRDHGAGRASLIARLPATGGAPTGPAAGNGLCLVSHLDVVTAEPSRWTHPPLSGAQVDGQVWGRGALDMKGMGVVELEVLLWLKRVGVPLQRDVVLLAVADEEVSGLGMQAIAADWASVGCSHAINEGGLGIDGALFPGQVLHAISVAEKGFAWVRVRAEGEPGHGSVAEPAVEAPARLLTAMSAIERRVRPRPVIDPALRVLLANAGRAQGGAARWVMQPPWLQDLVVRPKLLARPQTRAAITNTTHLTGMAGARSPNVVPASVEAVYDCRLLPGATPQDALDTLARAVRGIPGISLTLIDGRVSDRSPIDDPVYRALATYAVEGRPGHVAGPVLSVGFTDSLFLRPLGVHAYGYIPFVVTVDEADTMHGDDERVSVANLGEGTRRLLSVVVDVAGADAPLAAPPAAPPPPGDDGGTAK